MVTTGYHLKARDAYAREKLIEFKGSSTDTKLIHMFSCLRPNFHNKLKACSSQKKMTSAAIELRTMSLLPEIFRDFCFGLHLGREQG